MKYFLCICIFLTRSLVFPIPLFSYVSLHWSVRKAFLSLLAILWNSAFKWVYLSFSPLPLASLLFSAICKASSAAAAKSLQLCLTLCDPIDGSPPGSSVPGILQARTLEWVAISFSNARKWKWKWSRSIVSNSSWSHGLQPTRLLRPWDFPGKSTGVRCHCLLQQWNTTQP